MNVLSLFDGISCGQIALNRAGIKHDNYFASEIDKHAIKVTMANYPNTVQLGSVTDVKAENLPKIDLLIGGSPCQGFSSKGKQLNFDDPRSKLFFEFVRLLKECKPKYFLLENVRMKKEYQAIITEHLGVDPIHIDSSLVSAQNRKRIYWTNIPVVGVPENKSIFIEDILDKKVDEKYWLKEKSTRLLLKKVSIVDAPDICCIDVYNKKFKTDRKSPTLILPHHNALRLLYNGRIRKLTPVECERLQTVPDNYTSCVSDTWRYIALGNGWTVDVIAHIFKGIK